MWAHHHFHPSLAADILTMAKPLANGFPIGATMVSTAIADEIKVGDPVFPTISTNTGTTFGGNPLAAWLAHHVFQRLTSPEMYTHIATTSAIFQSRLAKLKDTFPQFIEEVRGRGLILGIQ